MSNSETTETPDFDSIRQVNPYGVEYWSARDLMPLLGYEKWERFDGAIKRAMVACEQSGNSIDDNFPRSGKPIISGKGRKQTIKDYNLSRFACYLIALNGEPSKPEIATAQVYFVVATRTNELRVLAEKQNERLEKRLELAQNTVALTAAAKRAGVNSETFGRFFDAGYKGLYGGLGVAGIKARKNIPDKEDLADRMGRMELTANSFRAGLAENKITIEGIVGADAAIRAHEDVGDIVRRAIAEAGATMPEDLPAEPNIKPLLEQKKKAKKKAVQPPGQANLFGDDDSV